MYWRETTWEEIKKQIGWTERHEQYFKAHQRLYDLSRDSTLEYGGHRLSHNGKRYILDGKPTTIKEAEKILRWATRAEVGFSKEDI